MYVYDDDNTRRAAPNNIKYISKAAVFVIEDVLWGERPGRWEMRWTPWRLWVDGEEDRGLRHGHRCPAGLRGGHLLVPLSQPPHSKPG